MKYLNGYKIFENKVIDLKVDDVVYFAYYYSYSATKDSADIFDRFIVKYQNVIDDGLLIISTNDSRKKMLSYAEEFLRLLSDNPKMKKDFIDTLSNIKDVYKDHINLLDIDDCLYSLIDEHPSIEYDFVISSNTKDIEVSLEVRKELCQELEEENAFESLRLKFKRILKADVIYNINYSKKMSNYLNNNVRYILK